MNEPMKTILPIALSAIALGIIVVGLTGTPSSEPTTEERVSALASSIKCPFCNGESLNDSASAVAADYRELIEPRVTEGATDQEILNEFAANFGESFILDTSTSGWSFLLWALPVAALIGGIGAIYVLRRESVMNAGTP
jgi:cytochrome c-type biogenesis protein CcmH